MPQVLLMILTFFVYLKDVAKFINQLKRDDENLRSVQDVQERWGYLSGY